MKTTSILEKIRTTAEQYYANGDYYCSEAIVKTIIDEFELPACPEAIKMASGFPVGIGGSGCTCGALSGGIMAIGLFFGRSEPGDSAVDIAMALSAQLHEKFLEMNRSTCCRVLTKGMELGNPEHMAQCVRLTGEVAYETARIVSTQLKNR